MTNPLLPETPKSLPATAVPRYALEPHARYVIDGVLELAAVSSDDQGHVFRRVDNPNLCESFTHAEFAELLKERMNIIRNYHRSSAAAIRLEGPERLITELPPKRRERLIARKDTCDAFIRDEAAGKVTRSDPSMKPWIRDYVAGILQKAIEQGRCGSDDVIVKRPPSPTALRKWLRKYEACCFDAMALRDGYGRSGNRMPRLEVEERKLMREIAEGYASRLKPTKASLYCDLTEAVRKKNTERRKTGERLLKKPSRAAFERVIAGLDPFMVCAGREGEEAARKKFFIVRGGLDVSRPLERVEMDAWKISLHVILEEAGVWALLSPEVKETVLRARLWLSVAIDCYTRCVLAARITDSNTSTAAVSMIAMAVGDKARFAEAAGCVTPWDQCGTMETLATDNDKAYTAYETRAAVTDMGSEMLFPPAGTPQNRARIERFFRTIHEQLVALFEGRTFENVVAKGYYEAEANAVIDADELGRVIVRWIVDVYHNTPHEGLGGETPRNCWIRTTRLHPVLPPPDPDVYRHIFGVTVERRITNTGVRVLGLHYQSEELQRLRRVAQQKPVLVRIDEGDLGYVSVRTKDGWLTVPCVKAGFDGVALEHWIATERALRREHAAMARLSEGVVLQALADIKAFSASATQRAGIASPIITSAAVDRLEHGVFRTFSFDRGPADGPAVFDPAEFGVEEVTTPVVRAEPQADDGQDEASDEPEGPASTDDHYGMED
ncbi:DDE-type integrase/transposase/recombinase [Microvirga sp. 3-52]|uniref:Mu transposase C-terminal domain-containing protein n=1 Tax=Microvirga sp. 3-52 TaxID=2792425 RepID=UPI001AC76CDB|nr:Mu transposase C-terminal domain-containing protein [Microvirga sp. 3-52]MBO1905315.1 DDE-type integrase/transposase/recombinase [Microvirga sp. 3-52]MBS7452596.1 DDE-type integrase/transposase/recombinase [Microvirga sp. 3-52]